jgi:hypothetical protein
VPQHLLARAGQPGDPDYLPGPDLQVGGRQPGRNQAVGAQHHLGVAVVVAQLAADH